MVQEEAPHVDDDAPGDESHDAPGDESHANFPDPIGALVAFDPITALAVAATEPRGCTCQYACDRVLHHHK